MASVLNYSKWDDLPSDSDDSVELTDKINSSRVNNKPDPPPKSIKEMISDFQAATAPEAALDKIKANFGKPETKEERFQRRSQLFRETILKGEQVSYKIESIKQFRSLPTKVDEGLEDLLVPASEKYKHVYTIPRTMLQAARNFVTEQGLDVT